MPRVFTISFWENFNNKPISVIFRKQGKLMINGVGAAAGLFSAGEDGGGAYIISDSFR